MENRIFIFWIILGVSTIFSCKNNSEKEAEIEIKKVNFEIKDMASLLFNCKNETEIETFLNQNKGVCLHYFEITENQIPELAKKLSGFISNPSLIDFYNSSVKSKNQVKTISKEIKLALGRFKTLYPNAKTPNVYLFFTGFAGKDLVVNDSTIAIGLDYFAGKKAPYRPQVYDYQLKKYEPENILPSVFNILGMKYALVNPKDQTLVADMVFYGKCFAFTQKCLPGTADSLLLGYSAKEIADVEASEKVVWGHFIDQKLLFETNTFKKAKYTEDRPNTPEINPECPGVIGRWLGLQIINSYQKNNKTDFLDLLKNTDAQIIFKESGYKGQANTEE